MASEALVKAELARGRSAVRSSRFEAVHGTFPCRGVSFSQRQTPAR